MTKIQLFVMMQELNKFLHPSSVAHDRVVSRFVILSLMQVTLGHAGISRGDTFEVNNQS